ncbi:MAG: hypothetical protein JSU92_00085 [Deltaproteobacteria bacterium]|nr:MAG: hypothetical protein JSU92_00085 [Deltaproteobacteria bacterium]
MKKILIWEITGFFFIAVSGNLLHFIYEWSGHHLLAGIMGAVNESVWEHFKLGVWPAVLFAVTEFIFIKDLSKNFFGAKAVGIISIPLSISLIFYTYTSALGTHILIIDIATFFLAVFIAQYLSYKIMVGRELHRRINLIGAVVLALIATAFIVFTFYPPHLPVFQDPLTGQYGKF